MWRVLHLPSTELRSSTGLSHISDACRSVLKATLEVTKNVYRSFEGRKKCTINFFGQSDPSITSFVDVLERKTLSQVGC
ncbi:uncharacterized protein LOC119640125 isoform X2 [Glossina fuscipes]|uniref:Uncharacterized protein LOC119640125 isoform X2 n=1 Tax=Glossina fuscipes TaxID=7396 RepID=A0A9C5ZCD8_9MUSC|nr:uncharacterized protein LOC119640125 isoform X2 [Glossina fuscipes]